MCEVVAGIDDEVRFEGRKAAHPRGLSPLTRGQVKIGQMQYAQRLGAGVQDRDGDPAADGTGGPPIRRR